MALLTPRDFEVCFKQPITPPSTVVSGHNITGGIDADRQVGTSGKSFSRLHSARNQLRQSVAWEVDTEGVSKAGSFVTRPGRSVARSVGGGDEVIICLNYFAVKV